MEDSSFDSLLREVLDQRDPDVYLALGERLLGRGDAEDAARLLEKGAALAPERPDIHSALGDAYALLGRDEDCIEAWKRSAEVSPDDELVDELVSAAEARVRTLDGGDEAVTAKHWVRDLVEKFVGQLYPESVSLFRGLWAAVYEPMPLARLSVVSVPAGTAALGIGGGELDDHMLRDLAHAVTMIATAQDAGATRPDLPPERIERRVRHAGAREGASRECIDAVVAIVLSDPSNGE